MEQKYKDADYIQKITDKDISEIYLKLREILIKKDHDYILDRLHDLIYVFGSVNYFHEENLKTFNEIRQGIEKHIKEKVINDVMSKDEEGRYLSFPTGETTNYRFTYVFDAYIFSAKRTLDFLAKLPASHYTPTYISENEIKQLSMNDFRKTVKENSTKYKSVSKEIRREMPKIVEAVESLSDWISYITGKRDGLIHRFAYKQLFFRAAVDIKTRDKWEIISWEFSTNPNFGVGIVNTITFIDAQGVVQHKDNAEALVKDCTPRLKSLIIRILKELYQYHKLHN